MSERIDLEPAGNALLTTLASVEDDHLDRPTPCFGHTVGELLQHLVTATRTLRAAAEKDFGPMTELKLHPDHWPALEDGWRAALEEQVPQLVQAWREDSAWEGTTRGGALDVPAEVAGHITTDELVLHGWDLARAIGQDYTLDESIAASSLEFLSTFGEDGTHPPAEPIPVADDAPVLDRLLALSGRDPHWSPG